MNFQDFITAIEETSISIAIREGESLFPWIESIHVVAIALVVGTISIIDLRLIGLPAHRKSVKQMMKEVLPLTWSAFAVAAVTGSLLFTSRAEKYVTLWEFDIKMVLLVLAGLNMAYFHVVTFRDIHMWDELTTTPRAVKVAGITSLMLWISIVTCGRLIGFKL